jgi:transcriptional regulator with XRE-family HTH domain
LTSKNITRARTQLGQRVRQLRQRVNKTLRDLSAITGLSKSTLSKIENGSLSVSYDTLIKLAGALSTDVANLMSTASAEPTTAPSTARKSLTRAGDGDVYETEQYRYELLCNDLSQKQMIPLMATLRAHSLSPTSELRAHPGEEFVYVLRGGVTVHTEFYKPIRLTVGDSLYFDSTMAHSLISVGNEDAQILWIATGRVPETPDGLHVIPTGEAPARKEAEPKSSPLKR